MADVFISYARADWDHAKQLADELTARGYQVWWDVELVGSDNFRDVIMSELEAAKAVIVIWSASSCCSNFVLDEAGRALQAGKLVALRLAEFDPQNLPLGFGTQHTELVTNLDRITPALTKLGIDTTAKKSAAEQARLLSEHAFWDEISASEDPRDFKLYLGEYPNGLHRASAKLRLRKLGADQPGLLKGAASLFSGVGSRVKTVNRSTAAKNAGENQSDLFATQKNSSSLRTPLIFALLSVVSGLLSSYFPIVGGNILPVYVAIPLPEPIRIFAFYPLPAIYFTLMLTAGLKIAGLASFKRIIFVLATVLAGWLLAYNLSYSISARFSNTTMAPVIFASLFAVAGFIGAFFTGIGILVPTTKAMWKDVFYVGLTGLIIAFIYAFTIGSKNFAGIFGEAILFVPWQFFVAFASGYFLHRNMQNSTM